MTITITVVAKLYALCRLHMCHVRKHIIESVARATDALLLTRSSFHATLSCRHHVHTNEGRRLFSHYFHHFLTKNTTSRNIEEEINVDVSFV
jgi:hypothetical protein